MIIDFHTHLVSDMKHVPAGFRDFFEKQQGESLEIFSARYRSVGAFLDFLDENGVDKAVVLAEVAPITSGLVTNREVIDFTRFSPRLIPFCSINPFLTYNMPSELEKWVKEGFRGLKLYPTYQYFYPNDSMLYPLYAKAQELQIPVMFHTGSSVFPGARLKYGDPLYLDDVAIDFPEMTIIQCHCGRPFWYDRAYFLAKLHQNIYMEISGLPPKNLLKYFPRLEAIADKVLFGSDWYGIKSVKKNITDIQALPISDISKELILGGNAARILGLVENTEGSPI